MVVPQFLHVRKASSKLSYIFPVPGQNGEQEKKKVKSVRFQEETNQSTTPATSLDQKKDMAIYMGYCILKNIMDAILFCLQCPDKRLSQPVMPRSRRIISNRTMSGSGSEIDLSRSRSSSMASMSEEAFKSESQSQSEKDVISTEVCPQTLYQENVSQKLKQTKIYLGRLQPLTLRVEILENIFSLLFLTHEDIQETMLNSDYESDVGDDNKSTRSLSTGAVTPASSLKFSLSDEFKTPTVVTSVPEPVTTETSMAYDVPFEEKSSVADNKNTIDMEKVGEALEIMKSSIKKKQKKLSDEAHVDGARSSISENISSMSTSSSVNLDSHGFVTNSYLVRDILAMLKDCIIDVSTAKYHIHGNKSDVRERYRTPKEALTKTLEIDPTVEESLCHLVKSSVTMETLQKKITQLERYTSEAHWRYQLVANENIPRSPGEVLPDVVVSLGGSSDEEVEIVGVSVSAAHRKRRRSGM